MAGDAWSIIWTADATSFVRLLTSDQRRATAAVVAKIAKGRTTLLRPLAGRPGIYEVACDPPAHGLRVRITFRERTIVVLGFAAPRPR
jgi:hypothetical protein